MSKKQDNKAKVSGKTTDSRFIMKSVASCTAAVAAVMLCTSVYADTPEAFSVSKEMKYYSESSGDMLVMSTDYYEMSVEEDGYPAVEAILEEANARSAEACEEFVETNREEAQEVVESLDGTVSYCESITPCIQRADAEIFSFTEGEYIYLGGAHGSYYVTGYTYDTQSGERLMLQDVTSDYDAFYQSVLDRLAEENTDGAFFDTYPETVRQEFYETDGPQWYVTTDELVLVFNQYDLAPYAAGTITLSYEIENYPELFNDCIVYDGDSRISPLTAGTEKTGDFNRDGEKESVYVSSSFNYDDYTSDLLIRWNGVESSFNFYGDLSKAYLVETADQRVYLYAIYTEDDDWQVFYTFSFDGGSAALVDTIDNLGVYGDLPGSPEKMRLYSKVNTLGSYQGVRTYQVGENGVPQSQTSEYQIAPSDWNTLTSSLDLQVWVQNGDSEEAVYYPAGTTFTARATDGETYLEAELEDGTLCKIYLEKDGYSYTISGVSEYDCFEFLPYAG
jgi:hypothetical protein